MGWKNHGHRPPIRLGYSTYQDPDNAQAHENELQERIASNFPRYRDQCRIILKERHLVIERPEVTFHYTLIRNELHLERTMRFPAAESFNSGVVLPLFPSKRAPIIIKFMAGVELEIWPSI